MDNKLYAFHPNGPGPDSFFVCAANEAEARAAVSAYVARDGQVAGVPVWPDDYCVEEFAPGEVGTCGNM